MIYDKNKIKLISFFFQLYSIFYIYIGLSVLQAIKFKEQRDYTCYFPNFNARAEFYKCIKIAQNHRQEEAERKYKEYQKEMDSKSGVKYR
jgi:hypothetical protein